MDIEFVKRLLGPEAAAARPPRGRVLLLHPPGQPYTSPPLGLLYLSSALKRAGVQTEVLDASVLGLTLRETLESIARSAPDILGLPTWTATWDLTRKITHILKKEFPGVALVLGGPHATALPEETLQSSAADFLVLHEAEAAFTELCLALLGSLDTAPSSIRGLACREAGAVKINEARSPLEDLDTLPAPDLEAVPYRRYRNYGRLVRTPPVGVVIGSRGCPFQCVFCFHSIFGKQYRSHSASRVEEEIERQVRLYGVREISFLEDNFAVDEARTIDLCERLKKFRPRISWTCNVHVNTVIRRTELLTRMKEAGCWLVGVGVESGSERIQKLLKKNLKLADAEKVFSAASRAGLQTLAFTQIGNWDDDERSVRETIDFVRRLPAAFATFNVTVPLPGSELWGMAQNSGLMEPAGFSRFNVQQTMVGKNLSPLRTRSLSAAELYRWMRRGLREFYFRPRQIVRLIRGARTPHQWAYLFHFLLGFAVKLEPRCMNPDPRIAAEIGRTYSAAQPAGV